MAEKKTKILICTHSAAMHSGLSETTRHIFIPLLQKYGDKYEIHQLGYFNFGKPCEKIPWPIYTTKVDQTPQGARPDLNDRYGQMSFDNVVEKVKPDIVFGYGDMWHFEHMLNSPQRNSYRMLCYYTIDGQPYFGHIDQNGDTSWGKNLTRADQVVVLSHFGKEVLLNGCPEIKDTNIKVMYHPMDMNRYPALNEQQKLELKDKLLPKHISRKAFVAGWLGKNQFRKQNYKLWETAHYVIHGDYIRCNDCDRVTIKEYNHTCRRPKDPDKYPGELDKITMYDRNYRYKECWHCKSTNIVEGTPNKDFYMWFHMSKEDPGYNADLQENMWRVKDHCIYTKNIKGLSGVAAKDVAMLLASWDCMLYLSGGEGFGNPLAEALAAGTPCVFSDYSSHAEFGQFGGLPVRCTYIPELHHGIQRSIVDTNDSVRQILRMIEEPETKAALGQKGRQHMSKFAIPHMVDAWHNILQDVAQRPLPIESDKLHPAII